MPTGNTSALYEGTDVTLRGYLMRIGRGMGFAILQRDDDMDEPVKPTEPHTTYHDEAIEKAVARGVEAGGWTVDEADQAARDDFDKRYRDWLETREKKAELRRRYEKMLEQVEAWQPDPLVAGAKDYALEQLRQSIEFDCGKGDDDMRWHPEPEFVPGEKFRSDVLERTRHDVSYHTAERIKEIARTDDRNKHVEAFLRSLPPEGS